MLNLTRKNKIVLSDYNYQRDIENRLLMSHLTLFEVDVLREILDSSLKTTIHQLAESLDVDEKLVIPAVDKLSKTKLFQRFGNVISVDKEMRKYYESQIIKFDTNFEPRFDFFFQSLMTKVPIHSIANWYSLCKVSDHIFNSIVESYLATPKIYETYLKELHFDIPVLNNIAKEVFKADDFKIPSRTLIEKYGLQREQFEEYMLYLEYNFVCCISYQRDKQNWEEIVTPFYEWKEFLESQKKSLPIAIKDIANIQPAHPEHFRNEELERNFSERDIREVKKSLKRLIGCGWVYFDDFLKGLTAQIGQTEAVELRNKGKRWNYILPSYSEEEIAFIKATLCGLLLEAGIVAIGTHQNKLCFCVTPLGRMTIGD